MSRCCDSGVTVVVSSFTFGTAPTARAKNHMLSSNMAGRQETAGILAAYC